MLDDAAMLALRTGATLAYALPTARLRLRADGRTVLEVLRPPFGEAAPAPSVAPCAFRRAVGAAHARREAGEQLSFLGLTGDGGPAVDIALAPGDRALPGDIYRVALGEEWLHLFATALPIARCKEAAGDGVRTSEVPDVDRGGRRMVRVGFHRDDLTDVTLVHVSSPIGAIVSARRSLDALEGVYGRCLVAELEAELAGGRSARSPGRLADG